MEGPRPRRRAIGRLFADAFAHRVRHQPHPSGHDLPGHERPVLKLRSDAEPAVKTYVEHVATPVGELVEVWATTFDISGSFDLRPASFDALVKQVREHGFVGRSIGYRPLTWADREREAIAARRLSVRLRAAVYDVRYRLAEWLDPAIHEDWDD